MFKSTGLWLGVGLDFADERLMDEHWGGAVRKNQLKHPRRRGRRRRATSLSLQTRKSERIKTIFTSYKAPDGHDAKPTVPIVVNFDDPM